MCYAVNPAVLTYRFINKKSNNNMSIKLKLKVLCTTKYVTTCGNKSF